jgi:hypothetical protein
MSVQDSIADGTAKAAILGGASSAVFLDYYQVIGITIALVGLFVNWYYARKRTKLLEKQYKQE